jgi:exonuclease III
MTGITTCLSILTLNVNGLNYPIKTHCLASWIKKEDPTMCCLQETHLIDRNKHWLRVKGWKKFTKTMAPQQSGVAILILDKVDFKRTLMKRDKEEHSILIKGEIDQKEITIINLYASNVNAPNFIKHTLMDLKIHINSNTVVVGDFKTLPSPIDRSSKQKNQQRNPRSKSHHRSNAPSQCLQNISSNFCTIYILLGNLWNLLQN